MLNCRDALAKYWNVTSLPKSTERQARPLVKKLTDCSQQTQHLVVEGTSKSAPGSPPGWGCSLPEPRGGLEPWRCVRQRKQGGGATHGSSQAPRQAPLKRALEAVRSRTRRRQMDGLCSAAADLPPAGLIRTFLPGPRIAPSTTGPSRAFCTQPRSLPPRLLCRACPWPSLPRGRPGTGGSPGTRARCRLLTGLCRQAAAGLQGPGPAAQPRGRSRSLRAGQGAGRSAAGTSPACTLLSRPRMATFCC